MATPSPSQTPSPIPSPTRSPSPTPIGTGAFDPAHDVYRYGRRDLDPIFAPRNVAVVGATEAAGSVGRTVLWNLIRNPFGGTVYPVNPKRSSVLGIRAYPSLAEVPEPVDLAVVVTPAPTVPSVIAQCADRGVRGAVVISAGFKEIGAEGAALEAEILAHARRGRLRVVGPNCLGVMCPLTGLNATFAAGMARPGTVAFISQSGALLTAILDWSFRENVGFSAFVSVGSMLDVGWGDLIYHLGDDPRTESIVLYMESIGDARAFMSAAREVALTKPIIVIKPGRTEGAARAAASHTGSLTGSDEVLDVALRRAGVLRVGSIADLFHMAEVLSKQPRPRGPRLTIVTNAGGPGVLASDELLTNGGALTELSAATRKAFDAILPPHWSRNNPIDILGDASAERYEKALEVAAKDPNADGLLVVLTPQAMTDATKTAERLVPYAHGTGKPILASWMGGAEVAAGEAILNRADIPTFAYPDTAARMFTYMWRYARALKGLYETPTLSDDDASVDVAAAAAALARARESGRTLLTEVESKALLAAYGIPTVPTRVATTEDEAAAAAASLGFPAVLTLHSETVTHKTDVGGVRLDLPDAAAVRSAFREIRENVTAKAGAEHFLGVAVQPMVRMSGYELIVGSSVDAQFGPVLLVGSGGQLVEVYKDRALGLPPLTTTLARRMLERTKVFTALQGVRGRRPADVPALERLLVRFSRLVVEQPWVREIDINPLLASPDGLVALDARVVLHPRETREADLPRPAVRPYPSQYVTTWGAPDGTPVTFRPIRPEDEPLLVRFHETLSDRSVHLRFLQPIELTHRVTHERLARICFNDYDREMALVAERRDPRTGLREVIAVGRLSRSHAGDEATFSLLVTDPWQGKGLGRDLFGRLIEVARAEGMGRLVGHMASENTGMRRLVESRGFAVTEAADGTVRAELVL